MAGRGSSRPALSDENPALAREGCLAYYPREEIPEAMRVRHLRSTLPLLAGAAAAALLALLGFLIVRQTRGLAVRAPLLIAAGIVAYGYFKHGFVAHDVHATYFFSSLSVLALAFAWRPSLRWPAAGAVLAGAAIVVATPEVTLRALFAPRASVDAAIDITRTALDPARSQAVREGGRLWAHAQLRLDPETESAVRETPVHVDP